MLFNSLPFLLFIAIFFCLWPLLNKRNTSKWVLIIMMSFLFYGWWDWRFLILLIITGSIDYASGFFIIRFPSQKKFWLWFSLLTNIGSLVIFKYSAWLASILNEWLMFFHIHLDLSKELPQFSLVLPVGISFYTFNSMSYTIDLYRGKTKPAQNILHFFAFISFFPHLVAGPIIRARDILQQLKKPVQTSSLEILNGLRTCVWGFFQKMVLADNIAILVNSQFNDVRSSNDTAQWWICMIAFAFQIYFDFNGYSTIARGIAKLCGIHFKLNFNHPYFAHSFQNFWQRWHISLSSFFRDYVYFPLGGNRKGKFRNIFNLWFTMLLSGLWHGANITFLIWGGLHALYLTIEKLIRNHLKRSTSPILNFLFSIFLIFIPVVIAWVFFRAEKLGDANYIILQLFSFNFELPLKEVLINNSVFWLAIGIFSEFIIFQKFHFFLQKNYIIQALCVSILVCFIIFFRGPEQQFIYFQF